MNGLLRNHWKTVGLLIILTSILCGLPQVGTAAQRDNQTIIVMGTAEIRANDTADAREKAINEGLVAGVGRVVIDLMPLELILQNFETLNEMMYARTDQFVQGYKVLTEAKYKNRYRVMVETVIAVNRVRKRLKDLGFLLDARNKMKILLMIGERSMDETMPRYWWGEQAAMGQVLSGAAMADKLKSKGFVLISPRPLPTELAAAVAEMPEPDTQQVIRIGKALQADVVIVGMAYAQPTQNVMGDSRSIKGVISCRAINVENGEEIAATYQTEISAGEDPAVAGAEAIQSAGSRAGEEMASQILAALEKREQETSAIKVIVRGTSDLADFVKFRRVLKGITGVHRIQTAELKADEAVVWVDYKESIKQLADALMLQSFQSFGVHISQLGETQMTVELMPDKAPPQQGGIITEPIKP